MTERPPPVVLGRAELEKLLEAAARKGAQQALAELGLGDDCAGGDLRDLRGLLRAWRDVRKTARRTLVTWLIRLALFGLVGWFAAEAGWVKIGSRP